MNIQIKTESQIAELKFSEQASLYNKFSVALGIKQIKKFRDKSTGISRIVQIQEQYVKERDKFLAEQKVKDAEKVITKDTSRQTRFDMGLTIATVKDESKEGTIENSIHSAIASGYTTTGKIIDHLVSTHKRPRSVLGVDEQYIVHNIKWFVKKGHLRLTQV